MSGHSKWATTKHKKAVIDSRRAKNFAKLIKAIEVAARNGGPDVDGNPTLFDAIAKAKKNSMPSMPMYGDHIFGSFYIQLQKHIQKIQMKSQNENTMI